jgi:hypothetical protein
MIENPRENPTLPKRNNYFLEMIENNLKWGFKGENDGFCN